jgi:hypothetical protein
MLFNKFWIIRLSGSRGEDFRNWLTKKQELSMVDVFVNENGRHRQFLILVGWFLKISQTAWPSETKLEGSIYGSSPIKIAHFVNKHGRHRQFLFLVGWFLKSLLWNHFLQRNNSLCLLVSQINFFFQPIRNKNYPWRPCLLSNWDEMRKSYRGPSIDASCKTHVLESEMIKTSGRSLIVYLLFYDHWPVILEIREDFIKWRGKQHGCS